MSFKFNCPNPGCGVHIEAEDAWSGQTVECPSCGTALVVPENPRLVGSSATVPAKEGGRTGLVTGLIFGVVALLAGGAFVVSGGKKSNDDGGGGGAVAQVSGPAGDEASASGTSRAAAVAMTPGIPASLVVSETGASVASSESSLIWVEGEAAASSNAQQHNWYNSVKRDRLSGGDWLNHYTRARQGEARWSVPVAQSGEYEFWVRANPTGKARLSWRVNGAGDWADADFSQAVQRDNIAGDGKIDMRFVAWVKLGKVRLEPGDATVEFRMNSGVENHGGIDCFVLSPEPFTPNGKQKPGEKTGLADPGTWAFEPGPESASDPGRLDLSRLNEERAGMSGFVAMDANGDFIDGAGRPLRFWAANTALHERTGDPVMLRQHARWLARRGVNMVRAHSHLHSKRNDARLEDVDEEEIDRIRRLVAIMREEGIYTTISPYWATATKWRPSLGLPDPGSGNLNGMLFWDEKLQAAYKSWWRKLLKEKNPHTGVPLADDPAVAILQLQNEDSLLFYTLQAVKGEARRDLRRKYHAFLKGKHGSIEKAVASWGAGSVGHKNDNPGGGEMGLFSIWELTQDARGARQNRMADQLEFYGRLMHEFNASMVKFFREELGCKQLINAGNWKTASAAKLQDIERWSYTATDIVGVNRYFNGGEHINPTDKRKSGYAVTRGDLFSGVSVLRQPRRFPLTLKLPAGRAFIISESSWVPPVEHQSEGPFLVAAYSSLTGFDAFYWFSTGDVGYANGIGKWQMNTPMLAGQFPAAAVLFRRGYVKRGEPVLVEHRSLDDLWQRRKPVAVEDAGYDPNRDAGAMNELSSVKTSMDPLAYLAGPVEIRFDSDPAKSRLAKVAVADGVVASVTGELKWDTKDGICTLDAPKAQGVTGFVKGRKFGLSALSVESANDYLTVLAVALDDANLKDSKQVLVQIGTTARPHGWRTQSKGDKREIVSLGGAPWNIAKADLRLKLSNQRVKRAEILDGNFRKTGEIAVADGSFIAPEDALYLLLVE